MTRTARERSASPGKRVGKAQTVSPPPERWRLPSGQPLVDFALHAGLVARGLIEPARKRVARRDRAGARAYEWIADSSPY